MISKLEIRKGFLWLELPLAVPSNKLGAAS